ncbi:dephospho-CoA kinase [Sphingomicrobium marinum]|uniref:dephospho-CoA kinase n=1 Tax=Sphingomicrobium marinum TaxID=1227950 RepID=UPI00223EC68D|nr:dephospho-CoA kinase [Sphingomicrobium marinum]
MKTIAITGSIGMGKSTVAGMFRDAGIPLFDADAAVREMQGPGGRLVSDIEAAFPGSTRDGAVDREALSAMVLGDRDALTKLEGLVHPAVHHERTRFILANSDARALAFEIPLLFETGGEENFDVVVVVSAPAEVQRERVMRRPGMTEEKLDNILARQMPDEEKRARADHVVDTSGPLDETRAQVDRILACLDL